mmetsp:Transcript_6275/g.10353  ORF Transcript_6275/g.10353 Transcript_6275/m.10353 type:complete len:256 (-) Transcript_6275:517-1284(-)
MTKRYLLPRDMNRQRILLLDIIANLGNEINMKLMHRQVTIAILQLIGIRLLLHLHHILGQLRVLCHRRLAIPQAHNANLLVRVSLNTRLVAAVRLRLDHMAIPQRIANASQDIINAKHLDVLDVVLNHTAINTRRLQRRVDAAISIGTHRDARSRLHDEFAVLLGQTREQVLLKQVNVLEIVSKILILVQETLRFAVRRRRCHEVKRKANLGQVVDTLMLRSQSLDRQCLLDQQLVDGFTRLCADRIATFRSLEA